MLPPYPTSSQEVVGLSPYHHHSIRDGTTWDDHMHVENTFNGNWHSDNIGLHSSRVSAQVRPSTRKPMTANRITVESTWSELMRSNQKDHNVQAWLGRCAGAAINKKTKEEIQATLNDVSLSVQDTVNDIQGGQNTLAGAAGSAETTQTAQESTPCRDFLAGCFPAFGKVYGSEDPVGEGEVVARATLQHAASSFYTIQHNNDRRREARERNKLNPRASGTRRPSGSTRRHTTSGASVRRRPSTLKWTLSDIDATGLKTLEEVQDRCCATTKSSLTKISRLIRKRYGHELETPQQPLASSISTLLARDLASSIRDQNIARAPCSALVGFVSEKYKSELGNDPERSEPLAVLIVEEAIRHRSEPATEEGLPPVLDGSRASPSDPVERLTYPAHLLPQDPSGHPSIQRDMNQPPETESCERPPALVSDTAPRSEPSGWATYPAHPLPQEITSHVSNQGYVYRQPDTGHYTDDYRYQADPFSTNDPRPLSYEPGYVLGEYCSDDPRDYANTGGYGTQYGHSATGVEPVGNMRLWSTEIQLEQGYGMTQSGGYDHNVKNRLRPSF
ncbi:hypothetical protein IAT40_006537 [Kwoniella sp. CBS 6097]